MRKRTVEIDVLRKEIKAKVSAIHDTNFMWCVNYYFAEFPTKSKFENSNFLRNLNSTVIWRIFWNSTFVWPLSQNSEVTFVRWVSRLLKKRSSLMTLLFSCVAGLPTMFLLANLSRCVRQIRKTGIMFSCTCLNCSNLSFCIRALIVLILRLCVLALEPSTRDTLKFLTRKFWRCWIPAQSTVCGRTLTMIGWSNISSNQSNCWLALTKIPGASCCTWDFSYIKS